MAAQTTHVKLQQHQPGGDSGHDLLAVQGHVQRALDQLQAQKVQQANIAAGAVSSPLLSNGLRQCFKYRLSGTTGALDSDKDITFDKKVSDDLNLVSGSGFKVASAGLARLHVHLQVRGGAIGANCRAQAYVLSSTGVVVAATEWALASQAIGSVYEIAVDLDEQIEFATGIAYSVRCKMIDAADNPLNKQSLMAESLSVTPYRGGSYIELMPTPGS